MARYKIIKFTGMSPLHLGMGRDSYDVSGSVLHSDTLTSALASLRVRRGFNCDVDKFLASFALSSAFPFTGPMIYLPRPLGRINVRVKGQSEEQYRKRLKRVQFVAQPLWERLAAGEKVEVEDAQLQGVFLLHEPDSKFVSPISRQTSQRVAVSRTGKDDARPFAFEWLFFAPGAGLYSLLRCFDGCDESEIVDLLRELGEQGVGSDRNVGGGHFDVEESDLEIAEPQDANATMLLSSFIPGKEELQALVMDGSRYHLMSRGGFMAGSEHDGLRHLRKNSVYMFMPGSVFMGNRTLHGKIVDLRPQWNDVASMHPVYRSGVPVTINVKL